jgi:hypothetical protein
LKTFRNLEILSSPEESLEDCEIIEHYLSLVHELRTALFIPRCIFVSSNTEDYGKCAESLLRQDFERLRIDYVNNLAWAESLLRDLPEAQQ